MVYVEHTVCCSKSQWIPTQGDPRMIRRESEAGLGRVWLRGWQKHYSNDAFFPPPPPPNPTTSSCTLKTWHLVAARVGAEIIYEDFPPFSSRLFSISKVPQSSRAIIRTSAFLLSGVPVFMNQIFDWEDSAPGQATVATIERSRWIRLRSAWSRTGHLGLGATRRGATREKKRKEWGWRGERCGEGRHGGKGGKEGRWCGVGGPFCKAVGWTYWALMGWLSFLRPFFFAVEELY